MDTIGRDVFDTADQERAHAERFYELLKEESGKTIFIDGGYPVDQQENLADLLKAAEHNEKEEFEEILPGICRDCENRRDSLRRHRHFCRSRRSNMCIRNDSGKWRRCFRQISITRERSRKNGSAQTADISMRENRRRKYVRSAVMSREIFFHMNLHHTVWIPNRIQDKEWSKCTKNMKI